jgi:trehalose 6-phosphate phosphatase
VAFDFDGTLSEIVPRPEDAVLDPALAPSLNRIAEMVGYLAVISARDRATLSARLPAEWLALGSYGLELPESISASGYPDGFDPVAARDSLDAVGHDLEALVARWPKARMERKTWGVAIHFRGGGEADYAEPATFAEVRSLAESHGCRAVGGRLVIEVEPAGAVDKGWAVRHLAATLSPSAVVFTGDDLGDVPAWRAINDLSAALPAVAVGIRSPEMPAAEQAVCDVVLDGREQLSELLGSLLEIAEASF